MEVQGINFEGPSGAILSDCKKYRFALWRVWDKKKPLAMFLMLNPSTADIFKDDPTIRRCISFAKDWGYGGILVGNLFAYRSTDPKELKNMPSDAMIKDLNNQHVLAMFWRSELCVLAYGNPPVKDWPTPAVWGFKDVSHLGLTKDGNPKHPLYLRGDTKPEKFEYKNIFS